MTYLRTVPPAEAAGEVRAMYERQQARLGYVPNYARAFSHRPEVMQRWADLLAEVRRPLEPRRFELVTLAAARALGSSYCALAHGKALTAFYAPDEVRAIATGAGLGPLSPAEVAMMRFARQVARDASAITAADVDALRAHHLSDAEIFDIAATAAARAFFTKVLDAVGAEPDAAFLEMDAALREALTVGRPIASRILPDINRPRRGAGTRRGSRAGRGGSRGRPAPSPGCR